MDAPTLDGVRCSFAHANQKTILSSQGGQQILDHTVPCFELQQGVQVGGTHGSVRQIVWGLVLRPDEQLIVGWEVTLHHHVHALRK